MNAPGPFTNTQGCKSINEASILNWIDCQDSINSTNWESAGLATQSICKPRLNWVDWKYWNFLYIGRGYKAMLQTLVLLTKIGLPEYHPLFSHDIINTSKNFSSAPAGRRMLSTIGYGYFPTLFFSCNRTSVQLLWYIVVISLLPPISCIYRGLSAIQNKQSSHTWSSRSTKEKYRHSRNIISGLVIITCIYNRGYMEGSRERFKYCLIYI